MLARRRSGAAGFAALMVMESAAGATLAGCGSELSVEDRAPDFALPSSTGETVELEAVIDQRPALLYFHMAVG